MTLRLLLLFGVSLAWAASYLFIGQAKTLPPVTATAAMTVIAALVILPGARFGMRRPLLVRRSAEGPAVAVEAAGSPTTSS